MVQSAPSSKLPVGCGKPEYVTQPRSAKMLIHLPIIVLTSFHPIAIADAVPKFDIARECQAEGGTTEMQKRCVDDETLACDQLQAEWLQFGPDAKAQCSAEAGEDGLPAMSNS
jgi:hypothetical protein